MMTKSGSQVQLRQERFPKSPQTELALQRNIRNKRYGTKDAQICLDPIAPLKLTRVCSDGQIHALRIHYDSLATSTEQCRRT